MTPAVLADLVRSAAVRVLGARGLDTGAVPNEVAVTRPRDRGRGDYATAVALRAAGPAGVPARLLAHWLADELAHHPAVAAAEVAGAGYVNVELTAETRADAIRRALEARPIAAPEITLPATVPTTTGELPLTDLTAAVGADAARFAALSGSTVDVDVLRAPTDENPFHVVVYVHAMLSALLRNGDALGVVPTTVDVHLLDHPDEVDLARTIAEFPDAVTGPPARTVRYLRRLADQAWEFTEQHRVLPQGDAPPRREHDALLALCAAARRVLATGLLQLGITAPQRL
ncbi:arginyl-tRNA synthetase [Actinokineospora baliensis]|uniref:DALR anticodon-binding domain-containing protein n=1 Tax=Actinokineospora baliensis TaxID=547056 RepID=UPI0019593786|nr:DALR anticodon-binding domain-containing protein [Actinokineospora baliensis]MBM7776525.1 arginyl-tRNA synthetase [Actinokineospora baliensis]